MACLYPFPDPFPFPPLPSTLSPSPSLSLFPFSIFPAGEVRASDPEVNDLMRRLGAALNIAEHDVRCRIPPKEVVRIFGPADLEVHRGHDGRIYCLDAARLMPPQNPLAIRKSDPNVTREKGFLYDLFRVEFVTSFAETSLSSDAFSGFGKEGAPKEEKKIMVADSILRNKVIPQMSADLAKQYGGLETDLDLKGYFHRHGVNMRFLGIVRQHVKRIRMEEDGVDESEVSSDALVMTLAGEMVARSAKHILRSRLRECRSSGTKWLVFQNVEVDNFFAFSFFLFLEYTVIVLIIVATIRYCNTDTSILYRVVLV